MHGSNAVRNHLPAIATVVLVLFANGVAHAGGAAQVYECRVNGQRVFSDQPCAKDAAARDVAVTNLMSADEAAIGYRSSPPAPRKRKAASDEQDPKAKRRERCSKLSSDKQTITSSLRAGYNVKQGERLRDRLRKVDSEYYDLRCSALR